MTLGVKGLELLIRLHLLVNSKNKTTFWNHFKVCIVFVRQLERNEISCQITGNGISEGLKFQICLGEHAPRRPPPPSRGERPSLVPNTLLLLYTILLLLQFLMKTLQITVTAGTFNFQRLSLRLSSLPIKKTAIYIFNIDGFIFNL